MSRIRCYTSGDEIKFLDGITEEDKPEFQDITDDALMDMFQHLLRDEPDIPSELTYEVHGADWYKEKFPGFDDEHYDIMVQSAKQAHELEHETIKLKELTDDEKITILPYSFLKSVESEPLERLD